MRASSRYGSWLRRIERLPIAQGERQLKPWRFNEPRWNELQLRAFRTFMVLVVLRERRSWPGSVRNYWRRKRIRAAGYFQRRWGGVPPALFERSLPEQRALYQTEGWSQWATRD